jgi:hypothetical protein
MYEKREYSIKSKIVKPGDIRRFAKVIDETCEEFIKNRRKKDLHYDIVFGVETTDGVSYSSDIMDIFNPDGVLDSKTIKRVSMHFRSYEPQAEAFIRIHDSRYYGDSYIVVEGYDSTWVNGIFSRLLDSLNSCRNQAFIGTKLKWPMSALSSVLMGLALVGIINIILNFTLGGEKQLPYWLSLFLVGFMGFISGIFDKFWPDVEIISGNRQSKASSGVKGLLYIIILPLIIAIIANLIFENI